MAGELGLPAWWLNEQASVYVAPGGDATAPRVFDHPGLRVSAASPEHLLAMKVLAARRRDAEDIGFLVKHLRLVSVEEVLALCTESSLTKTFQLWRGLFWRTCRRPMRDECLLRNPSNAAALRRSIAELERGDAKERELIDPAVVQDVV